MSLFFLRVLVQNVPSWGEQFCYPSNRHHCRTLAAKGIPGEASYDVHAVGCLISCCPRGNPEQHDDPVDSAEGNYDPICCLKLIGWFHRFVRIVSLKQIRSSSPDLRITFSLFSRLQDQHQLETWHQRLTCRETSAAGAHFHHSLGLVRSGRRRSCGSR